MGRKPERPVGPVVDPLPPGSKPDMRPLHGRWVMLEPVSVERHARDLYDSFKDSDPDGTVWTYLGYGPWQSFEQFEAWVRENKRPSSHPSRCLKSSARDGIVSLPGS